MFHTIKLSKTNPTPLYIQLATELTRLIQLGLLPPNTKLPTIRTLSRKLKINRDTVVSAYKVLEKDGFVNAQVGSGTYVNPLDGFSPYMAVTPPIPCTSLLFPKSFFPIDTLHKIFDEVIHSEGWHSFEDPMHRHHQLLKQSIAHFFTSLGIYTLPIQIRLVSEFYSFLIDLFEKQHFHCIYMESYRDLSAHSFLHSLGIQTVDIPLETDGMNIDILEKHLKTNAIPSLIWISSYLQNPTGISYSLEKKNKLIALAKKYNSYILEDGTFSSFYVDSLSPLYDLAQGERTIYFYHFSKVYLPETDYTFIVLPPTLYKKIPDSFSYPLNEKFLSTYLESKIFIDLQKKLKDFAIERQSLLLEKLLEKKDLFDVFSPESSLFFWVTPVNTSLEKMLDYFISKNIVISPGELFSRNKKVNAFRLSAIHLQDDSFKELLKAIHEFRRCSL